MFDIEDSSWNKRNIRLSGFLWIILLRRVVTHSKYPIKKFRRKKDLVAKKLRTSANSYNAAMQGHLLPVEVCVMNHILLILAGAKLNQQFQHDTFTTLRANQIQLPSIPLDKEEEAQQVRLKCLEYSINGLCNR